LFLNAAEDFVIEQWHKRAEGAETRAEFMRIRGEFDAWQYGLSRDKSTARPNPDLDQTREWTSVIWASVWAVSGALVSAVLALYGESVLDGELLADPSLDNDLLVAQMMRSMRAGF
jgi:hypothetical protein